MNFNVTEEEARFVLEVLGQLPTSSGAYPLVVKLQGQILAQANKAPVPDTTVETEK